MSCRRMPRLSGSVVEGRCSKSAQSSDSAHGTTSFSYHRSSCSWMNVSGSSWLACTSAAVSTSQRQTESDSISVITPTEKNACPHDYRWHSRKNATQMPAMIVRLTSRASACPAAAAAVTWAPSGEAAEMTSAVAFSSALSTCMM